MGCIFSACATCVASCCGGCAGQCCATGLCACSGNTKTRAPYLVIMFLGVMLSIIVRYWSPSEWVAHLYWFSMHLCTSDACVGQEAVYRISATLCVFFAIHAACMLSKATRAFHYKFWIFKVWMLPILLILFFLIPNGPFDVYAIISRFVSGIFLVLQIIVLIEFAYSWNTDWASDEKQWYKQILACCAVLYGAAITLCVFSFKWFTDDLSESCRLEAFFIGFTIALTTLITGISISGKVPHGALLPSGVITLYSFYLCYSALASDPTSCNSLQNATTVQVIVGIIIAGVAICYAGWNLSNTSTIFGVDDEDEVHDEEAPKAIGSASSDNSVPNAGDADQKADAAPKKDEHDETVGPETPVEAFRRKRDLKFHVVMAVASMYFAMVLTSWGSETESSGNSYDMGKEAMWIKIVSQWVTVLFYLWTLVAPVLFPDRDFGVGDMGSE